MSIRLRLALFFAVGTAVLYAIFSVVSLHQLNVGLDSSVDADLTHTSQFMRQMLLIQAVGTQFENKSPLTAPSGFVAPHSHGSPVFGQLLDQHNQVIGSLDLPSDKSLLDKAQFRSARSGPVHLDVTLADNGGEIRVLAEPDPGASKLVLVVGDPLGTGPDAEHGVKLALLILFGPVVALAGLVGWLLARASLHPVEVMRRQAETISAHDDDARLEVPETRDEVAGLAVTMNDLLERMRTALRRQQAFVSDAGHELRTPLAILQGELELASRPGRSRGELTQAVTDAADEARRLSRLAEDLLLLARGDESHMPLRIEHVSLDTAVSEAIARVRVRAEERGIELASESYGTSKPSSVEADATRLQQAIGNLLDNALRHAPPGSTVTVRVGTTPGTGAGTPLRGEDPAAGQLAALIEVRDAGPGFPPDFLPHAFERFRRPDGARARGDGGTGLGLAIVRSIAESHGGRAGAENLPGGGALVWLTIPM